MVAFEVRGHDCPLCQLPLSWSIPQPECVDLEFFVFRLFLYLGDDTFFIP